MKRLYLKFYLALLASLAIFAVLAALGWKLTSDRDRAGRDERALIAEVIAEILPPADAPVDAQRAALERWQKRSGVDLALFDEARRPIASAGRPLPAPASDEGGRERRDGGWRWSEDHGPPIWSVRLPDGRWAVARPWRSRGGPPFAWGALLVALAAATAIGAYPLVRRLTRRLERLQIGVEALGAGDLSARVPVHGRDEIALLADRFNRSAERIEALVGAQRSLLANASHELRSPLTRLRMAVALLAERGRADPRSDRLGSSEAPAPGDAHLDALRREVERNVDELDALVDEILLASRLDAGAGIAREPVDLLALLAEECARAQAELQVAGPPGASEPGAAAIGRTPGTTVTGDPRLLRRLLRNLLENARRHGAGTPVDAVLRAVDDRIEVDVCDVGPGVPEAERQRIFEPFYRLAGHGEGSGGVGLGLALVAQIARHHGAEVRCLAREGRGSCFRVTFPRPTAPG